MSTALRYRLLQHPAWESGDAWKRVTGVPVFRVLSYYALLPLLFLRTLRFCFLPGGPPEPPLSV